KKRTYEKNDVQEYIIWRVLDNEIDWFALDETGKYAALERDENGIVESKVFAGLGLNVKALLYNDLQRVMSDLQNGIASKEHAVFVDGLSENRKTI
ncbi:MAG: Uma2 family endonuclease, partial [Pyrinomonadaceae bacterium]|nr:Uma2 family endonuclease [Pyrinomonadaceae bacterium]